MRKQILLHTAATERLKSIPSSCWKPFLSRQCLSGWFFSPAAPWEQERGSPCVAPQPCLPIILRFLSTQQHFNGHCSAQSWWTLKWKYTRTVQATRKSDILYENEVSRSFSESDLNAVQLGAHHIYMQSIWQAPALAKCNFLGVRIPFRP